MSELVGDVFALCGLLMTLIGAAVTARAVILREDDAIAVGITRIASSNREENLRLPMVQNLLWSSRAAMWGLIIVVLGTALQALPIIARLIH